MLNSSAEIGVDDPSFSRSFDLLVFPIKISFGSVGSICLGRESGRFHSHLLFPTDTVCQVPSPFSLFGQKEDD